MKLNKITAFFLASAFLCFASCNKGNSSPVYYPSTQIADSIPVQPTIAPPVLTGMGSVLGRVVDPTGKGLKDVAVSIKNVGIITSFTGDFQLNNIPAGNQIISLKYGNREITVGVNVVADTAVSPELNPVQFSNNGTNGSGIANTQLQTFQVDQDFLNQWQAKSVAVLNNLIYVIATDANGFLTQKGTIIRMDADTGKTWKDLGTKWYVRHPMDKTVAGIAVNSSNIIAVDTKGSIYNVEANKAVATYKSGGGTDIAIGGSSVYIVNGSNVEKTDPTGQSRVAVKNLTVSGGIGADAKGNVYAVSGKTIKKAEFSSITTNVTDVIKDGLVSPVDVAVDDKNNFIYVLDGSDIKRFSAEGVLVSTFGTSCIKPVSIATDENGQIFVADEGKDYKTSKIVKFAAGSNVIPQFQNQDYVKAAQSLDNGEVPLDETASSDEETVQ